MWTRIYLGVLAAAILTVGFFTYYSLSWLQSIGRPEDAVAGYDNTASIASAMLSVCSIVLAFVSIGVLWTTQRAWALWVTFAYFAVFRAFEGFYLDRGYQQLVARASNLDTHLWATPVITVLEIVGAAVITLVIQYGVHAVRQKFYPSTQSPEADIDLAESESSRLM